MSTTLPRPQTEFVTDSPDHFPRCDPFVDPYRTNFHHTRGRVDLDTTLIFDSSPQPHPNDQFYYTENKTTDFNSCCCGSRDRLRAREQEEANAEEKLPPKQAAEVAAAARFISKVQIITLAEPPSISDYFVPRPRLGSLTSVRDSILDTSLHVPKSRSASMQADSSPKRSRAARPPPLQLSQARCVSEDILTPLPQRVSSKGAPSFDIARSFDPTRRSQRAATSPSLEPEPKTPLTILTPESATTFQFDFDLPAEPQLSRSTSDATTDSQSPPTPPARPSDDQVRREIEAFALKQGPFLRGSQPRRRKLPVPDSDNDSKHTEQSLPALPNEDENVEAVTPMSPRTSKETETSGEGQETSPSPLRRKKGIFNWLQKKPEVEVDDLIDLYLTDEQKEGVKHVKRKASKTKLAMFRNRVITDPLPINTG